MKTLRLIYPLIFFLLITSCAVESGIEDIKRVDNIDTGCEPVVRPTYKFTGTKSTIPNVSPHAMVARMGRGINLGNTLEASQEGNWRPKFQTTYFQDIAAAGFKNVRIPVRWDKHTTALPAVGSASVDACGVYTGSYLDYTVDPAFLDRVELAVNTALANNLVVIIDTHHDDWLIDLYKKYTDEELAAKLAEDPDYEYQFREGNDRLAALDRFDAIWIAIAERFKDKSENLIFEIVNEPYFTMNTAEVNYINDRILKIIRQSNPFRNVIITGGSENSFEAPMQIPSSFILKNNNLIATFHYYLPFAFTSSSSKNYTDNSWGASKDKQTVDTDFNTVRNWAISNNIPLYLGEFGADNVNGYDYLKLTNGLYGGPDEASRVAYHKYIADKAIELGFSFSVWDAGKKANKSIYLEPNPEGPSMSNDRTWVESVKNAVLGN